jgi:hypothetical protein
LRPAQEKNWWELDPRGADGKSLFYDQRHHGSLEAGLGHCPGPRRVGFQGETPKPDGCSYLDRTIFTALTGRERQVIEISRHDGKASQVTFDAE